MQFLAGILFTGVVLACVAVDAAPCTVTCVCKVSPSFTTGVGDTAAVKHFANTGDANVGCMCCDYTIVDQLSPSLDFFTIAPVASDGPYTVAWRPEGGAPGGLTLCNAKPLRVASHTVAVVRDFNVTECSTTQDACTGSPIPTLVQVVSSDLVNSAPPTVTIVNMTLTGNGAAGSCSGGLTAACHNELFVTGNLFQNFFDGALGVADPGPGVCPQIPDTVHILNNTMVDVGGGSPSPNVPAIALPGPAVGRLGFFEVEIKFNELRSKLGAFPLDTAIHIGRYIGSIPSSVVGNRVAPNNARVAIRFDLNLGYVFPAGSPTYLSNDIKGILRWVSLQNQVATGILHDIVFGSPVDDFTLSFFLYCTQVCPPSPFSEQPLQFNVSHNVRTNLDITPLSAIEFQFTATFESDRVITPILHLDAATAHNELVQLDTCASRVYPGPQPTNGAACNASIGSVDTNGWTVTSLPVPQGDFVSRWSMQRTFRPVDLAACERYNSPGTKLVSATTQGSNLVYSGETCFAMNECDQSPVNAYYYACTPFSILFTSAGAVTGSLTTEVVGITPYLISANCSSASGGGLTVVFETLTEHTELPQLTTLQNATVVANSIGGGSVFIVDASSAQTCSGTNANAATHCHQLWTISTTTSLAQYLGVVSVEFTLYIGAVPRALAAPAPTLNLNLNVTCPSVVNATSSANADLTVWRDYNITLPYTDPVTSPPFTVPGNELVYARTKALLGPSTESQATLDIQVVLLCMATSGTFAPYSPLAPTSTGCATPNTNPLIWVVYDAVTGNVTQPDTFNAQLYRLPGQLPSEQNVCFNATAILSNSECALVQVFYAVTPTFPPLFPAHKARSISTRKRWQALGRGGQVPITQGAMVRHVLTPFLQGQQVSRAVSPIFFTTTAPNNIAALEVCVRCAFGYTAVLPNATFGPGLPLPVCDPSSGGSGLVGGGNVTAGPGSEENDGSDLVTYLAFIIPVVLILIGLGTCILCRKRTLVGVIETTKEDKIIYDSENGEEDEALLATGHRMGRPARSRSSVLEKVRRHHTTPKIGYE